MAQGIVLFLHNLFTAVWIGGLFMLALTVIPAIRGRIKTSEDGGPVKTMELFSEITSRHRKWVFISIAGLFITGLMLGKAGSNGSGFMSFSTQYDVLASIKHIATFFMVIAAAARLLIVSGKIGQNKSPKRKQGIPLIYVNFVLGIVVLLLSAMMAVL